MEKRYIRANDLLEDSFRLAAAIYSSGFRPDLLVGVWRGGTPVAIAVQEYLEFKGLATAHMPIRISSYSGIDRRAAEVAVEGLDAVAARIGPASRLLVVDDVFDTGRSIQAVLDGLSSRLARDMRPAVRIACPWYKPARRLVPAEPDYFLHRTDDWLVFPHEIVGLSDSEIRRCKGSLAGIVLNPGD